MVAAPPAGVDAADGADWPEGVDMASADGADAPGAGVDGEHPNKTGTTSPTEANLRIPFTSNAPSGFRWSPWSPLNTSPWITNLPNDDRKGRKRKKGGYGKAVLETC